MKRKRLWVGIAAILVVAIGATGWALFKGAMHFPGSRDGEAGGPATKKTQALLNSGITQGRLQNYTAASATFKRVLSLDSHNKFAWYNIGLVDEHDGKTAEARRAYDRALELDPHFGSALFNEAVLVESSDPNRAIELLDRAIDDNPKASTAYLRLGRILANQGHDEKAQTAFDHAAATDPALGPLIPAAFRRTPAP